MERKKDSRIWIKARYISNKFLHYASVYFALSLDLFRCSFDDLIKIDESVITCDTCTYVEEWDIPVADLLRQVSNDPLSGSGSETEED